jgi:hypothetical protein
MEGNADCDGLSLGDNKHPVSMVARAVIDKRH